MWIVSLFIAKIMGHIFNAGSTNSTIRAIQSSDKISWTFIKLKGSVVFIQDLPHIKLSTNFTTLFLYVMFRVMIGHEFLVPLSAFYGTVVILSDLMIAQAGALADFTQNYNPKLLSVN